MIITSMEFWKYHINIYTNGKDRMISDLKFQSEVESDSTPKVNRQDAMVGLIAMVGQSRRTSWRESDLILHRKRLKGFLRLSDLWLMEMVDC